MRSLLLSLLLFALPISGQQLIPQIEITAQGSGYYRVFFEGEQVSQHVAEREAIERWANLLLANPSAEAYYDHDYWVSGKVTGLPATPAPPTNPPVDPNPGGVVFQSNWSHATGNSIAAYTDGGKFPVTVCTDQQRAQLFSVVAGSTVGWTATPNVLQVTNRGPEVCGQVGFEDKIPDVSTYYLRFYLNAIRLSPGAGSGHTITQAWGGGGHPVGAVYWAFREVTPTAYRPSVGGQHVGLATWGYAGPLLNQNEWYRFEFRVEFYDPATPTRLRIWPFIYDEDGNLVGDASSYISSVWPYTATLASDYAAGGYRTAETMERGRHGFWGYEGNANNNFRDDSWAYAAVEVRTDRFPGPVAGGN